MDWKQSRKRGTWFAGLMGLGLATFLLGAAMWCPSTPAHASPRQRNATSDTVTLALTNGSDTFYYGVVNASGGLPPIYGPSPIFQGTVTLAQPFTANYWDHVGLQIDGGPESFTTTNDGDLNIISTQSATFTIRLGGFDVPPGDHTAVAVFENAQTHVTTTSNSVPFTIQKSPFGLGCTMRYGSSGQWAAGTSAQIRLDSNNLLQNTPLDWSQGTATVSFVGPTTVTFTNVQPDSSGDVTVTTPTQVGLYAISCSFTSTDYYTAVGSYTSLKNIDISQLHPLAGIHLYTNPTTITASQATLIYVAFQGVSGLPAPTGTFSISIYDNQSGYYGQPMKVGANGALLFKISALPGVGNWDEIRITYSGDPHYANKTSYYSMTNPAIPSGSTGGGTGGTSGTGGAAPSKGTPASSTPAASSGSGSIASTAPGGSETQNTPRAAKPAPGSPFNGWLIALLLIAIVVVGGAGAGAFVLIRRRAATD